ncbi:hypothetical protein SAMN05443144_12274 [Fodinibius roseus]|uniref:Uncharacterized protein n=1 Tax=Fodinibius roseus TaxID=1194090 RepID=A0A1M5IAF0_9BACT|nr:hypothetical protein [Fodinibius roseus]SHG24753.1 hypothetical protein SAMN05443144_12274 [Fodinibius roseus]
MQFREIDPEAISSVDSTLGFIWFKADGRTYYLGIEQVDFDLDQCSGVTKPTKTTK